MPIKTNKNKGSSARVYKHKPKGVSAKSFERIYWPYLPLTLIISLMLVFGGQSGTLSSALRNPTGNVLAYATSMSVGGLLGSTNDQRAANGVATLSLNSKLNAAAQAKANDMAARNYWSHNTPEGDPPWVFIEAQGYAYQKLGENLAAGFSSESATVGGWMASAPHKANLLDPAFSDVGFGFANNENYTSAGGGPMTIVVAHYGKPTVLAAAPATPAPVTQATPSKSSQSNQPAAEPAETPQEPKPAEVATPSALDQPYNSEGLSPGAGYAKTSSNIQTLLGDLPMASMATTLAIAGSFAALGLWVSRHALAVRRAVVMGENFAIRHPLVDVGLVAIAALLYLFSRTAGLIQ
ncbi:hypothetical protein A3A68_01715 [Candidatus Saccharibacteria bacterium RIFCSPLOWO2_01_FULL_48_13]|nr:MAG: hypothetical protein A3F38_00285 [Candidatus Saccharibacteria bacterium RIFCSPHIGHO2_12_FULL_48_21]OGL37464.1 MAG: hypothetical protein A3A68_01715 [Candidatus Saccharibacteria bacterium RIFCSPLOWO2_01_FULL_48_13]